MRKLILILAFFALIFSVYTCSQDTDNQTLEKNGICETGLDFIALDTPALERCYVLDFPEYLTNWHPILDYIAQESDNSHYDLMPTDTFQILDTALQILELDTFNSNALIKAVLYIAKGDQEGLLQDYPAMFDSYTRGEKWLSEIENSDTCQLFLKSQYFNKLGLVYMEMQDKSNAIAYFNQYEQASREIGNLKDVAVAMTNKAITYYHANEPHKAMEEIVTAKCIMNEATLSYTDSMNLGWLNNIYAMCHGLIAEELGLEKKEYQANRQVQKAVNQSKANLDYAIGEENNNDYAVYLAYTLSNLALYSGQLGGENRKKVKVYADSCRNHCTRKFGSVPKLISSATNRSKNGIED